MNNMNYFYLVIALSASVVWGQGPSPVRTAVVKYETIADLKIVTGSLRAGLESDIASLENGRIDEFSVTEGMHIKKGDVIAKLDSRRIVHDINVTHAQIKETESGIARFYNELEIHEQDYHSLLDAEKSFNGSVSQQQLRQAKLLTVKAAGEISILQANLVTLKEQLGRIKTSLTDTEIKAPFTGIITEKYLGRGSRVSSGGNLVRLQSSERLEAWLNISETIQTEYLKPEHISIQAHNFQLSVKGIRIIPRVNEQSRNYTLIAELNDDNKHGLIPGMSITATVPNGIYADRLLVPNDAIMRNAAGYFVFKAQSTPQEINAVPLPVQILFRTGAIAAVQCPDLKAGDRVITEGNERLFPMMPVSLLPGAE